MRHSRALTLVEVVIIVMLLFVLLGLILSGLEVHPRELSDRNKCSNNLRQIGLACKQYAQDNDGWLPASGTVRLPYGRVTLASSAADMDVLIVNKYLTDLQLFRCPSSGGRMKPGNATRLTGGNIMDYYYFGRGYKEDEIGDETALMTDACAAAGGPAAAAATPNHKGMFINVLYGDTHIEGRSKGDAPLRFVTGRDAGFNRRTDIAVMPGTGTAAPQKE